jgi:hypothetical protein
MASRAGHSSPSGIGKIFFATGEAGTAHRGRRAIPRRTLLPTGWKPKALQRRPAHTIGQSKMLPTTPAAKRRFLSRRFAGR